MRKLCRNISSLRFCLIAISLLAGGHYVHAGTPVARVDSVVGHVFLVNNEKTRELRKGDHISDFSEIFTEVGSQITFSDFYDHRYHLAGSGHLKIINKVIELGSGFLWFQTFGKQDEFYIQTPNSQVGHRNAEGIISFDQVAGKSQLLVIKGQCSFGNLLEKYLTLNLSEGQFSFISEDYERGAPRRPTPIGFSSYKKITSLFKGVKSMDKREGRQFQRRPTIKLKKRSVRAHRKIASLEKNPIEMAIKSKEGGMRTTRPSEGKILIIDRNNPKLKKEREDRLINFHLNKVTYLKDKKKTRKWKRSYKKKTGVEINIFGSKEIRRKSPVKRAPALAPTPPKKVRKKGRSPASVVKLKGSRIRPTVKFESELLKKYKEQKRHSNEMNELIEELKSIDMDYKKNY